MLGGGGTLDKERSTEYKRENKTELAIYIEEQETNQIPLKDSGYFFDTEKSKCSNGAVIQWDDETWSPIVRNVTETRTKCSLYFKKEYQETLLNGTDPVITGSLIPVVIEPDGTVKKADIRNKWYSYEEKQWANAVILENESVSYQNGEVIPENNIESYFVWIPRYRYQIFNEGKYNGITTIENKVQTIQVVFENEDTPISNGSTVGSWLTHPAFTSFNSNGMWVGKFETGKKSGNDNVRNGEQVQIKPNVVSWGNFQIANAFYSTYDYKRELDSHMMKNTEWGAVAYLQYSNYGSMKKIRMNNNSASKTGFSAVTEPSCASSSDFTCNSFGTSSDVTLPYNTEIGYLASTTANISGIYDMSGGSFEYVMGVMKDEMGNLMSGRNSSNNSGFKGSYGEGGSNTAGYEWPAPKYYDSYNCSTSYTQFYLRILGDATGEMGPFGFLIGNMSSWNNSRSYFLLKENGGWFVRGDSFDRGIYANIFTFTEHTGFSTGYKMSFRTVLTP